MSSELVDVILEFLEAAVHQLLFVRRLYAEELFERQRLYGIAVRRSRHPDLNAYISEGIAGLRTPLVKGTLARLVLVVKGPSGEPVERFVIAPRLLDAGGEGVSGSSGPDVEGLEAQLRGVLLKLQYVDTVLRKPTSGCSFELCIYTESREGLDPSTWIEEQRLDPQQQQQQWTQQARGGSGAALELASAEIVPLKSCALPGAFELQLFAEV